MGPKMVIYFGLTRQQYNVDYQVVRQEGKLGTKKEISFNLKDMKQPDQGDIHYRISACLLYNIPFMSLIPWS